MLHARDDAPHSDAPHSDALDSPTLGIDAPESESPRTAVESRERGATLLFALAILALLVLFSTVFARLMSLERRASAYYTDRVRAKLAARAGIERAIVELRAVAGLQHFSDPHKGGWEYYDQFNSGPGGAGARPAALPVDDPGTPDIVEGEPLNLLNTVYPSFFQVHDPNLDGTVTPAELANWQRYGTPITYSGYLGTPYNLDDSIMCYRLKILDTARQLNLNHPDSRAANRMLTTLLFSISDVYGNDTTFNLTLAQAQSVADILIAPDAGEVYSRFRSKPQIGTAFVEAMQSVLGIAPPTDPERYDRAWQRHLRDKITVYSWVDSDVIRPWALNVRENTPEAPRKSLGLMPRSPVNLNTASTPVLIALFNGLAAETRLGTFRVNYQTAVALAEAIVARRRNLSATPDPNERGIMPTVNPPDPTLNNGNAALSFQGKYTPFKSWPEFEAWLDAPEQDAIFSAADADLRDTVGSGVHEAHLSANAPTLQNVIVHDADNNEMDWAAEPGEYLHAPDGGLYHRLQSLYRTGTRDLVKAMLNPNTMLNKLGSMPTHGGFRGRYPRMVDKSDVVRMTTEGCFDSLGVFEITSTGVIYMRTLRDPAVGFEVHAGHTDLAIVRVYSPFRLTTQQQFERHRALMVEGNLIETPEKGYAAAEASGSSNVNKYNDRTALGTSDPIVLSTNTKDYLPSTGTPDPDDPAQPYLNPGWPGMVSWPQFSTKRVDTNPPGAAEGNFKFPMPNNYAAADWGGYLTLTNMITVRTGDHDFIAGFSRGRLDAFKVRAWWEPRDLLPSGGKRPDAPLPTRPDPSDDSRFGGAATDQRREMKYLASPLGGKRRSPLLQETGSALVANVREEFTPPPDPNPVEARRWAASMFSEGSSLINTGVLVGPDRRNEEDQPASLAYDSNNIDLVKGSSIRFWFQPTRDPYVAEEEVLFYFKGSNGDDDNDGAGGAGSNVRPQPSDDDSIKDLTGWRRPVRDPQDDGSNWGVENFPRHGAAQQAGFQVIKRVDGVGGITLSLEDIGNGQTYRWSTSGSVGTDVTPDVMQWTTQNMANASEPQDQLGGYDPTAPEWIPGVWHWIVINIGPGLMPESDGSAHPSGVRTAFASLQIDKCDLLNPDNGGPLEFKGNNASPNAFAGARWGSEILTSHDDVGSSGATGQNANFVDPSNSDSATFLAIPRFLGDFYHCGQHDPILGETSSHSVPRPTGTLPNGALPSLTGEGAVLIERESIYRDVIEYWDKGDGNGNWEWVPWANGNEDGEYRQSPNWPEDEAFPRHLVSERRLELRYGPDANGDLGRRRVPFDGNEWVLPLHPYLKEIVESGGSWVIPQVETLDGMKPAKVSMYGDRTVENDYGPTPPAGGPDARARQIVPYPGGPSEWTFDLHVVWWEVHYFTRHPWASRPYHAGAPYYVPPGTSRKSYLPENLLAVDLLPHPDDMTNKAGVGPTAGYVHPTNPDITEQNQSGVRVPYPIDNSGWGFKNNAFYTNSPKASAPGDLEQHYLVEGSAPTGRGSYVRSRTGLTINSNEVPLDAVNDDCHGCEGCDVDGPVFIGSRPTGGTNYDANGYLTRPHVPSMACGVFDNIVFVNGDPDRRTDFPQGSAGTGELFDGNTVRLVPKNYEDRFYEEDLAAFLTKPVDKDGDGTVDGPAAPVGTGAIYHRGLLELRNRSFRVSSATWTSYPTAATGLDFELGLWKVDDREIVGTDTVAVFRYSNDQLLKKGNPLLVGDRDKPMFGRVDGGNVGFANDPTEGFHFGHASPSERKQDFLTEFDLSDARVQTHPDGFAAYELHKSPYVDGIGNLDAGQMPQLLILGVRLQNYEDIVDGSLQKPDDYDSVTQGVLLSPVLETPILEDITLNLTYARPQLLYAEEGAIE